MSRWHPLVLKCWFVFCIYLFPRWIRVGQVYVDQLSVPNRPVLVRLPWTFASDQKDCSGVKKSCSSDSTTFLNSQINSRTLASDYFIAVVRMRPAKTGAVKTRSNSYWHNCLPSSWLCCLYISSKVLSLLVDKQPYFFPRFCLSAVFIHDATHALSVILFLAQVEQSKVLVKEGSVQLLLTIVDTPGFGDAVDNSNW